MPEKTVGYIRSNVLGRVMGLFDEERITAFQATRSLFKQDTREMYKGWIFEKVDEYRSYEVKWSRWDKSVAASLDLEKVRTLVKKLGLGDMVVQLVEFEFVEPRIVRLINEELERIAREKGKPKSSITYLQEADCLYATFRNNNSKDLRSLRYVRLLNQDAIRRWKFKTGVLDLVRLETERAKKYGERERIPVFEWPDIARLTLGHLDESGWPREERRVEDLGEVSHPKPFALRRYKATAKKGWALVGEEEV